MLGIFIFVHFIQVVYPRHNVLLAATVSRKTTCHIRKIQVMARLRRESWRAFLIVY